MADHDPAKPEHTALAFLIMALLYELRDRCLYMAVSAVILIGIASTVLLILRLIIFARYGV
jgi:hypothetical protein